MGFQVVEHFQDSSMPGFMPGEGRSARQPSRPGFSTPPVWRLPAPLRRLEMSDPSTAGAVIDQLRRQPVLIALPPVYALLAAPTADGIAGLNRLKRRLPGKNYGTAVGQISNFWNLVERSTIPFGFDGPADLEASRDIFFRCTVAGARAETPVLRAGTHQTLILDEPYRSLMCEVEEAFQREADPELFGGHRFSAPLITSCNLSGDPLGSITDKVRASSFAEDRGVGLWVGGAEPSSESGSYPILELEASGLSIRRDGGSIRRREIYTRFGKES